MYSSSVSTNNPVVEQFNLNKQNLSNLKRDISPLASAALALAQTAREMKAHVTATTGKSKTLLFAPQGGSIQSKDLINLLGDAKDTLKDFASKAKSLDQEVDFFRIIKKVCFEVIWLQNGCIEEPCLHDFPPSAP